MKHHGMIFNAEMVRAILAGRKTQTRRPAKPQPDVGGVKWELRDGMFYPVRDELCRGVLDAVGPALKAPIQVGDIIWVRETWGLMRHHDVTDWCRDSIGRLTQFDIQEQWSVEHAENWRLPRESARWRPSIHMPRWASRIDLQVTAVRVERVRDISEEDAKVEGVNGGCLNCGAKAPCGCSMPRPDHRDGFAYLWNCIYANWDANPWVWVYEFRRAK
jgi:hypothetical protein